MSYNPDAIIYETQVVISNNSQPASSTTGSFVNEGTLSTKDTFITGQTVVNNVNITPNTNDIIYERQSTLLNNRNNFTDIEDFTFNSSYVTSFKAIINVTVSTGEASHAVWEMNGLYKPNGWVITSSFTGDITGVFFSMRDDAGIGKIQYTNSNTSGTSIIRYRASTTAPPGTTPEGVSDGVGVSLVTSGNFIPNSLIYANGTNSFASTDITYNSNVFTIGGVSRVLAERATSFVSFSNGGAITSMGDASIAKKLIVGDKIGIATTAPGYTLDINGDLNFNGSLYQNGAAYKSSQWLSTGDNISYTTGSVHTIGLTTGNLNFTGDIYRNGVLYSGSAWITGTDGSLSYTSGSLIANNFSAQNAVFTNSSLGSATINDFVNLRTDNLSLGVSNMYSGSFTANNNVSTPANITGLAFDNGVIRSFNATVTITVLKSNNQNLYESYTLDGFQNGSGWILYPSRIGDDSGILFTISNTGQVKYTSIDHAVDWISTTIRFNVSTMNNQEGYSSVDFNTSGNYTISGITAGNINFTGALFQNGSPFLGTSQWDNRIGGGISFTSGNVVIKDLNNTNISSTSLNATGITAGSINFTSDIYKNGVVYSSSKWTATSGNISFTSGTVNATGIVASTMTTGSLRATTTISAGTLAATHAPITNITASTLRVTNSTISSAIVTNLNATTLTAGTAVVSNANITTLTAGTLVATNSSITNINATTLTTGTFIATNSSITNTTTNTLRVTTLTAGSINTNNTLVNSRINTYGNMLNANTAGNSITIDIKVINKRIRTSRANANSSLSTWNTSTLVTTGLWYAACWSSDLGLFLTCNNYTDSPISNQGISVSSDGINWSVRGGIPQPIRVYDICWSPELSLMVATNNSSSQVPCVASSDGWNWNWMATVPFYRASGICWSPELRIFVVGVSRKGVLVSSDGINWTNYATNANTTIDQKIVWSAELGIFVLTDGNYGFFYSTNGTSWTFVSYTSIGYINCICWCPELYLFVAGGTSDNSTSTIATSPDGINWTTRTVPVSGITHNAIIWNPDLSIFITASRSYVFSSSDGINWTTKYSNFSNVLNCCWSPELSTYIMTEYNTNNIYASKPIMPNSKNTLLAPQSKLMIDNSGNLGVGNTNPLYKVDINGNLRASSGINTSSLTTASLLSSGLISTTSLAASNATSTNLFSTAFSSGTINATTIVGSTSISSGLLAATNLVGTNISSSNLIVTTLTAGNISFGTMGSSLVKATVITAGSISLSGDLVVGGTLTTVNITTTNLTDVNISTGTLNASSSTISNVLFTNISSSSLIVSNIINTNANITTLTAATLLNTNAVSTNVTSSSFNLTSTNGSYTLGITNGNIYFQNPLSGYLWYENTTTSNMRLTNGNLTVTGDITGFGNLSDIRLKKNIIDIAQMESLRVVNALRPVTFDWKDDIFNESKRNKKDAGFIAQELEQVIPYAVSDYTISDINYKNIKYERILPYLVGSIQKLTIENNDLKNKLAEIESLLKNN